MLQPIDISKEFIVTRYLDGVKFARPEHSVTTAIGGAPISVGDLLEMPYNVFFHNPQNLIVEVNEACWNNCGLLSRQYALGRDVRAVCKNEEQAAAVIGNNQHVLKSRELLVADEELDLWNSTYSHTISFKFPWYNDNDALVGVFGCAVHINDNDSASITKQLTLITQQFMMQPVMKQPIFPRQETIGKYFSSREIEVIKHVMRGKTMREIGEMLGLSRRTIESYFENIKIKANVKTRSEFFDKMMSDFK